MNKTTLTELIEHMDKVLSEPDSNKPFQEGYYHAVSFYRDKAIALLEKEREDMAQAFDYGKYCMSLEFDTGETAMDGWTSFNNNFTQYNPKPTP